MERVGLAAVLLAALPVPAAAQVSPHGVAPEAGERFCAQVFLERDGDVFGHVFAAFRWAPDVAERPAAALARRPHDGVFERVAFWWSVPPDSAGAYMVGAEDTVWRLRLGPSPGDFGATFHGTLRQVLPEEAAEEAGVGVVRFPCPGGGGRE